MKKRVLYKIIHVSVLVTAIIFIYNIHPLQSEVLSSSNYRLLFNSLNCGGDNSSSTNYRVQGTLCEPSGGDSTSTSYVLTPGFRGLEDLPFITVQFTDPDGNNKPNSVEFGTLSTSSVKSDRIGVTISTNAERGYAATITADGPLRLSTDASQTISGASDNPTDISAGSGRYGFKTSNGSFDSNYTDITTSPKTFSSATAPVSARAVTLTFAASPGSNTTGGSYTQTLTIIATGTF